MADTQEPEILLAQRLASNEKVVRNKALRKLRKYISVRSQKGGFTHDELLKLWKGLFYCLWMQDKPLLQENLSSQISTLIYAFQDFDKQLLFLESFFVTFKREWTGIDRLRMDKYYQLVRFMFRETFEVLKTTDWEKSAIGKFAELLTVQLLQSSSGAPSGLTLHILDLYLTELSAVGALQLAAEDNLTFIQPFCKAAAKTKDRTLLAAICSSIFTAIIDQAPFAIEDLIKEVEAAQDSDSGKASDQEEEEENQDVKSKPVRGRREKHINGNKENEDEDLSSDETEPVLQFDYSAVADKLFEWASRSNTPAHNRQRLYKIIKVFRNLHEGVFPRMDDLNEVSTDEDDDMFGSRKFIPRRKGHVKKDKEGEPAAKKKKKEEPPEGQSKDGEPAAASVGEKKKKKKKKRNKTCSEAEKTLPEPTLTEDDSPALLLEEKDPTHSNEAPSVLNTPPPPPPSSSSSSTDQPTDHHPNSTSDLGVSEKKKRRRKRKSQTAGDDDAPPAAPSSSSEENGAPQPQSVNAEGSSSIATTSGGESTEGCAENTSDKSERKVIDTSASACPDPSEAEEGPPELEQPTSSVKVKRRKKKNCTAAGEKLTAENAEHPQSLPENATPEPLHQTNPPGLKKNKQKKSKQRKDGAEEQATAGTEEAEVTSNGNAPTKKKKRKIPVEFEYEREEEQQQEEEPVVKKTPRTHESPTKAKPLMSRKSPRVKPSGFVSFQKTSAVPKPLYCRAQGGVAKLPLSRKKNSNGELKSKKVTFGLKNNKTAEFKKTDRSLLLSPDGSSRVPFDPQQKPRVGVLKSPPTRVTPRRTSSSASKLTPKKRAVAADFF